MNEDIFEETLEKPEGTIKNGQSRGNIGYTSHRTKTNKQNTTQKIKKMSNIDPIKHRA